MMHRRSGEVLAGAHAVHRWKSAAAGLDVASKDQKAEMSCSASKGMMQPPCPAYRVEDISETRLRRRRTYKHHTLQIKVCP